MIKTVLFDLDGTLTDSGPGIMKGASFALSKFGIDETDTDKLRRFVGPPLKDSFHDLYGIPEEKCWEAITFYREYYTKTGIFENAVYPGIPELLKALKEAGKKVLVATSKPEPMARIVLEHFNLTTYFDLIIGATMDEKLSEKEEIIRLALKMGKENDLVSSDLSEVIMVGDRNLDIQGAHKNGLKCIGVTFGYGSREELEQADADQIADSAQELQSLLLDK